MNNDDRRAHFKENHAKESFQSSTVTHNDDLQEELPDLDEEMKRKCETYIQKILINRAWYAQQIFERLLTSNAPLLSHPEGLSSAIKINPVPDSRLDQPDTGISQEDGPQKVITQGKPTQLPADIENMWTLVHNKPLDVRSKKEIHTHFIQLPQPQVKYHTKISNPSIYQNNRNQIHSVTTPPTFS